MSVEQWNNYRARRPLNYSRENIAAFPSGHIIELSRRENLALISSAEDAAGYSHPYHPAMREDFIEHAKSIGIKSLNARTIARISKILTDFGAVLVQGLPVDIDLPDTPVRGGSLLIGYKGSPFVAEYALMTMGAVTGAESYNFRQDGNGTAPLIDNVVPVRGLRKRGGAGGFENNFPFHTEAAWHPKRPDYLAFVGIRGVEEAKTIICSAHNLEHPDVKDLFLSGASRGFRMHAPELYVHKEKEGFPLGTSSSIIIRPVTQDRKGSLSLRMNLNGISYRDEGGFRFLVQLEDFIEEHAMNIVMGPGDAVLLNNSRVVHTRTGYEPKFNGQDRWFLRAYFNKDLWRNRVPLPATEVLRELQSLGWITEEGQLTSAFARYVEDPAKMQTLEGRQRELAAAACFYTPVPGFRIV